LLIGVGKVKKVIFNFVAFDGAEVPPVPPFFRRAREKGTVEDMMLCENMLMAGLKGAAERLPFYPTRTGLGTDLLQAYPEIQTFSAPYTGEKLVAMPSLPTNVALIHVNLADPSGHGVILGNPDFDPLFVKGAKKVFLSAEKVVPLSELKRHLGFVEILRIWVDGVVETPFGAHPGSCYPDYSVDEAHLREYLAATREAESFQAYVEKYISQEPARYLEQVGITRLLQLARGG
ncbi:MAG TPA: CoA-transferase, partial [Dehalococcoidia bacterium]|nr:CoA-transferase [Dehalococcoidia bacterium]